MRPLLRHRPVRGSPLGQRRVCSTATSDRSADPGPHRLNRYGTAGADRATTAAHTRGPRDLRLHEGLVERVAFAWPNPGDSAATGSYGDLELVYTVAFTAADLFGTDVDHILTADLGEGELEAA